MTLDEAKAIAPPHHFNLSWMPFSVGYFINTGCDTYGDVVICIGRVWCSWDWKPKSIGETRH